MTDLERNALHGMIDSSGYPALLARWRRTDSDNVIFQGQVGVYFTKEMLRKKNALPVDEQLKIQKLVKWVD